jgi:hypothetical protein
VCDDAQEMKSYPPEMAASEHVRRNFIDEWVKIQAPLQLFAVR